MKEIEKEDEALIKEGIKIIAYPDSDYPPFLREIPDPPPCLYVKGETEVFKKPSMAIVGTRRATIYGLMVAETFAKELVLNGFSVTSGLARGIDSAAHKGSLAVKCAQIAVLGTGIDTIYPPENKELAKKIIDSGGAIITEFPPKTPPFKKNFPQRNRIIAGLSYGTLIVEAEEHSGSLVTARFTIETGRELFAIPHNITNKSGIGPNYLIQKGAKLVMRVEDIIEELPESVRKNLEKCSIPTIQKDLDLSEEEVKILNLLKKDEEKTLDYLIEISGFTLGQLLSIITTLKMKELCEELPGNKFIRK